VTRPHRLRAAFTLIEMMAVVLFTGIVLTAAVNFYLDLSAASQAATERTREGRRAVALLDRVARDLEEAVLLTRPEGVDPLAHPWIFLAESRGLGLGADRLKFVSLGRTPRSDAVHESDLEMVAYVLVASETDEDAFDLVRWSSPRLPEARDHTFPLPDADGALVLAEGIGGFGIRFLSEDGTWTEAWDSSQISESSTLPVAAEIQVVPLPLSDEDALLPPEELPLFARQVALPVRPLDPEDLTGGEAAEADEEDEDLDCLTVDDCLADNPNALLQLEELDEEGASVVRGSGAACFADVAHLFQGIAIEGCEE
jgi:type II secretory pathway pseudopilin PulG